MDKYINGIKRFINKNINKQNTKEFLLNHKNTLIVIVAIILLGGITTIISYAYFTIVANQSIVGGQVGSIANINMYYFVEDKNASTGAGLGTYSKSVYVPRTTYTYNSSLSYCKHGSTLSYNATTYTFTVSNTKDACYAYFDVSESKNADIVLNLYTKKNGEFKLINEVPNNAELYTGLSSCTSGATMSLDNGEITVNTTNKTVCNAYFKPYYGPYVYWNNNFNSTNYTYPNVPSTTYTTNESLQNTAYVRKSTIGFATCIYENNTEYCLEPNYWETDLQTTKDKLQADMEATFGQILSCTTEPASNGGTARCGFSTYNGCIVNQSTVSCFRERTDIESCQVSNNNVASCNWRDPNH